MNFDIAPYFDDYSELKNFSKILFKPSPAIQARELNQLQTLLQTQIRRFGDNILKQGTIVSGGQLTHHISFPYVKIKDVDSAAGTINPSALIGRFVRNAAGVTALIVTTVNGQESAAPDLNTLYVKYTSSGTNNNSSTFSAGDSLTVFDGAVTDTATITVALAGTSPIGTGYGLTINEGVVYHAGYFTRTPQQLLVITKYNNLPDNLCVGYDTTFQVVTADDDATLYNNANGFTNFNAPGADRLKATATAIIVTKDNAQSRPDFLSIVEFTQGQPYKMDPSTQYNVIDQTLAKRTFEESGNYVVDKFLVNTKSAPINLEPAVFQTVVDPGVGYLNGYRIATTGNYTTNVNKATASSITAAAAVSVDYGNYIIVNRVNGDLSALVGSTVNLNSIAQTYAIGDTIAIGGATIGSARIRGIEYGSRDSTTTVKLYLFDVLLNAGYTFQNVLSINKANFNANVVGTPNLVDTSTSRSIFNGPTQAIKAVANVAIVVQKGAWGTLTSNTSGYLAFTLSGTDTFETTGTLSQDQLNRLLIAPVANTVGTTNRAGTVATTSASSVVTGTGSTFTADFVPGDWISINGAEKLQIASVSNNTSLVTTSNSAVTGSAYTYNNFYPARSPVRVLSGSVSPDKQTLTTQPIRSAIATNFTAICSVQQLVTPASKSVSRNVCARLSLNSNIAGVAGPWAVGHSDVIRLRGVYLGANTTFVSTDSGITDVTPQFYIDANHNTDYIGTGYLYKKGGSTLTLQTTDRLLVVFDILTTSSTAVRTIGSYPINDGLNLASSNTTMNTLELPEVFGQQDSYYDVRDAFDFRPTTANTITINTSQSSAAINPTEPAYASRYTSIGLFPAPHSTIVSDVEYYLPRMDRVVIDTTSTITVVSGQPGVNSLPAEPRDCLTINTITVPQYPSIPNVVSPELFEISDTKVSNDKLPRVRINRYKILTTLSDFQINNSQPRGYTMKQIGQIDKRLSNVEYYVALTRSESQAKSRLIPSALVPSTDRFKFGLFVDSFSDSSLADLNNPQYAASIASGVLQPKTDNVVIQLQTPANFNTGGLITLPYSSVPLVQQLNATNGPPTPVVTPPPVVNPGTGGIVVTPPPVPPAGTIVPPPVVVPSRVLQQEIVSHSWTLGIIPPDINGNAFTIETIFASSQATPMILYFGATLRSICVEVYQGKTVDFPLTTPIYNTSNAVALDGSDFASITEFVDHTLNSVFVVNGRPVASGSGKIVWTHNPVNGQYYKIKVYRIQNNYSSGYISAAGYEKAPDHAKIYFGIDGYSVINQTGSADIMTPINFGYDGVTSVVPPNLAINSSATANGAIQYYAGTQTTRITVHGLKPSTAHYFFFDGSNSGSATRPIAPTTYNGTTNMVISDSSGNIVVDFLTDFGTYVDPITKLPEVPRPKVFTFQSADGTSIVDGIIGVASYATTSTNTVQTSTPYTSGYSYNTGTKGTFSLNY
jgi:hypothetical protein